MGEMPSRYPAPEEKHTTNEDLISMHPVRLSYSAESAAIQQCFSLTTNQRTVLLATINQRNEQTAYMQDKGSATYSPHTHTTYFVYLN
jgi:hypothetical protein